MSGVRYWSAREREPSSDADGKRERWNVSGPHFAGWEIYHVKGSLATPTGCTRRSRAGGLDR